MTQLQRLELVTVGGDEGPLSSLIPLLEDGGAAPTFAYARMAVKAAQMAFAYRYEVLFFPWCLEWSGQKWSGLKFSVC